jgi:hypothetical protein
VTGGQVVISQVTQVSGISKFTLVCTVKGSATARQYVSGEALSGWGFVSVRALQQTCKWVRLLNYRESLTSLRGTGLASPVNASSFTVDKGRRTNVALPCRCRPVDQKLRFCAA